MRPLNLKVFLITSIAGHIAVFTALTFINFSLGHASGYQVFYPAIFYGPMPEETTQLPVQPSPHLVHSLPDISSFIPQGRLAQPQSVGFIAKPQVEISSNLSHEPVKSQPVISYFPVMREPVLRCIHSCLTNLTYTSKIDSRFISSLNFALRVQTIAIFISLRRKISSGNLEADLLSMRYIGHYLFIQQEGFASNVWQTVKIEFSPRSY